MILRLALLAVYVALVVAGASLIEARLAMTPATTLRDRLARTSSAILQGAPVPDVAYRAARALEAGHRVRAGDVAPPGNAPPDLALHLPPASELIGKYLTRAVARDANIPRSDVSAVLPPALVAQAGPTLRVWLGEEQKKLVAVLDVGWTVDVCNDTTCLVTGAAVVAVACKSAADDACAVLLAAKPSERAAFVDAPRKDKLVVVVNEPRVGG